MSSISFRLYLYLLTSFPAFSRIILLTTQHTKENKMANEDLKDFYRKWLDANRPSTASNVANKSSIVERELNEPVNTNSDDETMQQDNEEESDDTGEVEPPTTDFDSPEDIIFENDQIQLLIERGNFVFKCCIYFPCSY